MKKAFVIPAAIALAFHALIFVGSGKPPVHDGHGGDKPKRLAEEPDLPEVLLKNFEDVFNQEKTSMNADDKTGAETESDPFRLPELPVVGTLSPFEITQEVVWVKPGTENKLPTSNFGRRSSNEKGNESIITAAMLDNKPAVRNQREPVYPYDMKKAGISGTVWVEFVVDENGRVQDVRVRKTTHVAFNDATIAAVSAWRFEPGLRNGLPVRFRMTVPVVFNMKD